MTPTKGLRRTPLRRKSKSKTATIKDDIQALLREVVIKRDGGCVLRDRTDLKPCNGYNKDGELVLQADHVIERSNSATYADSRLVVCVCKGHHGWKHFTDSNHARYDQILREILPKERVELWDKCRADQWRPNHKDSLDWMLAKVALQNELKKLQ